MIVESQTKVDETSSPSITPVKLRLLSEVYARCNINMIELEKYEDAATDNA